MIDTLHTENAPEAIGPYSQAKIINGVLYASGQIAINPATSEVEATTIEEQTEQVCQNIGAILEAAGTDFSKVIKTTCFLKNMADFGAFNTVYGNYLSASRRVPASQLPLCRKMFWLKWKLSLKSKHKQHIKKGTVKTVPFFLFLCFKL